MIISRKGKIRRPTKRLGMPIMWGWKRYVYKGRRIKIQKNIKIILT